MKLRFVVGRQACLLSAATLAWTVGAAQAQTSTKSYTYDALGRLVVASTAGGENDDQTRSICYDSGDNRTAYDAASDGSVAQCVNTGAGGTPTPDPTGPFFSISDARGTEGTALVFTVTKTGAATSSFSVDYATASGTAGGHEFAATSGTLTFSASQTSKTISVDTYLDLKVEGNEVFYVNLSNASGSSGISDAQGVGTMWNDDSVCAFCLTSNVDSTSQDTTESGGLIGSSQDAPDLNEEPSE